MKPELIAEAWEERLARFREAMARLVAASSAAISARRSEQRARSLMFTLRGQMINFAAEHGLELPPDLKLIGELSIDEDEGR